MMALDVRSLVVFRICLGLYILYDIWMIRLSLGSSLFTFLSHMYNIVVMYQNNDTTETTVDYNIGWYTSSSSSDSEAISYLQQQDTPHQSPIHQIWFYRGHSNGLYQYSLLIMTSCMTMAYTFGIFEKITHVTTTKRRIDINPPLPVPPQQNDKNHYCSTEITISIKSILYKLCFWLLVTSYQNQNMYLHDGSDNYTRLLLLYSCEVGFCFSVLSFVGL